MLIHYKPHYLTHWERFLLQDEQFLFLLEIQLGNYNRTLMSSTLDNCYLTGLPHLSGLGKVNDRTSTKHGIPLTKEY